ncbi:MAG: hypothetical protein JY451_04525 [Erythrobacter sp.]|nr:MAG: hypothetical protein JY451_04525 [Erythrobacter sp.]
MATRELVAYILIALLLIALASALALWQRHRRRERDIRRGKIRSGSGDRKSRT